MINILTPFYEKKKLNHHGTAESKNICFGGIAD